MKGFFQGIVLPVILVLMMFSSGIQISNAFTTFDKDAFWPNANPGYIIDASFNNQGPGWSDVAKNSANDWNALAKSPLRFHLNGGAGNNHLRTGDIPCDGTLALTDIGFQGNTITDFQVEMNVGCGYPYYDGTQSPILPKNYFNLQSVVEHELGHGLGLCHSALDGVLMSDDLARGVNQKRKKDDNKGNRFLYDPNYNGKGPTGRCPQ